MPQDRRRPWKTEETAVVDEVICNAANQCPVDLCIHKIPHKPKLNTTCGPSMVCFESRILSGCVPVVNSEYETEHWINCPRCKGHGYALETKKHKVRT